MTATQAIMPGYENDLFVSYRRFDKRWIRWTQENFVGALESLLRPGIGRLRVYMDLSMETGAYWPHSLALNLSRSKLLLAVLSRDYFQSDWCRLELALMHKREELTNFRTPHNPHGLVIPVVIDDGDSFPQEARALQAEPLHEFANPFLRIDSEKQEKLAERLRERLCPAIERALQLVPPLDPAWETIAHDQFEHMFRIKTPVQTTVPSLRLSPLP